jgi:hypothetical protein
MAGVGYLSGDEPFVNKMAGLPPNTFVTVRDPGTAKEIQLQVVTPETIFPRRQYPGSPEWKRSGDKWSALLCVSGDKNWAPADVLFLVIDEKQYLFNKRRPLGPEGFKPYEPVGQQFGHSNPHKATLEYNNQPFDVKLIGIWDVESQVAGESHIPVGTIARWMLAELPDGTSVLVEDCQLGSEHDSVWEGLRVDLNRVVTDILTPDGK